MMRLIAWTLMWLALCPMLLGAPATLTRYVDTDAGNDTTGDGLSPETAWASLDKALTEFGGYGENSDGNFTATGATYPEGIIGIIDCSGSTLDAGYLTIDLVTDVANYLEIRGSEGYTLSAPAGNIYVLRIGSKNVRLLNVDLYLSGISRNGVRVLEITTAVSDATVRLIGCTLRGPGTDDFYMTGIYSPITATVELNNCLIYGMGQNGTSSKAIDVYKGTLYTYNTIIDDSYVGIIGRTSRALIYNKNCIVTGTTGNAYESVLGTFQNTYCTADDATATTYDTGTTCTNSVSPTFTGDYQLAAGDTLWHDGGVNLSEDPHWHAGLVDAFGNERPAEGDWSIGWHQWPIDTAPPPPGPLKMFWPPFIFGN